MKLNIIHPEMDSFQTITDAIDQSEVIFRSPHVGNLNNAELNLIMGICSVGGQVQVELVDTIKGDDSYSNPRVVAVGNREIPLVSNKKSKNRIVGSCTIEPEALKELHFVGIHVPDFVNNLKELHLLSLGDVMPDGVSIVPSSNSFAELGAERYGTVIELAKDLTGRPLRRVLPDGKIAAIDDNSYQDGIYGVGDNLESGVLPPLEAMMAIEIIKTAISTDGQDTQIVHVGGPDMVVYTKNRQMMSVVDQIAQSALSRLGINANLDIDYVVPCMKSILDSPDFEAVVDEDIVSQYDIIKQSNTGVML